MTRSRRHVTIAVIAAALVGGTGVAWASSQGDRWEGGSAVDAESAPAGPSEYADFEDASASEDRYTGEVTEGSQGSDLYMVDDGAAAGGSGESEIGQFEDASDADVDESSAVSFGAE